jgi:lipid-A-disaccharide synthase
MVKNKFLIIAGEPSGDHHAALLVSELKKLFPDHNFFGIGGEDMANSGVKLLYRMEQLAFLGLAEIIRHLPFIQQVFKRLRNWIKTEQPAAVILIDYPGFNLRLARIVKKLGIPVVYYICPQLWAWGKNRIKKIRKNVDLPLVIFKFEEEFYAKFGITAKFVGHPLVEEISPLNDRDIFCKKHALDPDKNIIALLPGSRLNEVKKILPELVKLAVLNKADDQLQWVVGKSVSIPMEIYQDIIGTNQFIRVIERDTHSLMKFAHVAFVASGTATLETGFLETPMIVLYKVSPFTYHIGKHLVKIGNIALVNIVLGRSIVPELIQDQVKVNLMDMEFKKYLNDADYYLSVQRHLSKVKEILGPAGASERAAQEIENFLRQPSQETE